MRWWQWVLTVLVVGILIFGSYSFVSVRNLEVEQLDEDLYVLYGLGGNVAVLSTDEGAVIVDTMTLQYHGDRIM